MLACGRYYRVHCGFNGSKQCVHPLGPGNRPQLELIEGGFDLGPLRRCLADRFIGCLGRIRCSLSPENGFDRVLAAFLASQEGLGRRRLVGSLAG